MKIAIIVAPFLLVGGYIAADFYRSSKDTKILETEAKNTAAYRLVPDPSCQLPAGKCILRKDKFRLIITTDKDFYHLESNSDLQGVTLGLAQPDRVTRPVQMQAKADRKHWLTLMRPLSNLKNESPLLLRLAVEQGGSRYYAELEVSTDGPWSNYGN